MSSAPLHFTNPLIRYHADPWIYKHTDGTYYFTATLSEADRIEIRRASTIHELTAAPSAIVWNQHVSGPMSANIWAPELHYIQSKWYIYFAAAQVDAPLEHRMYVLENPSVNPLAPSWNERGPIQTTWDSFAIDATTFEHHGTRYLVWAQKDPVIDSTTNLYIAPMGNPWTLSGPQVLLSKPDYRWEQDGLWVNEGPAVIKRNGKVFITYSASATFANYCLGLLTATDQSDLLDPASWSKAPTPIFQGSSMPGRTAPGHNSFTVSSDGTQDILVYHAREISSRGSDTSCNLNRHTRLQEFSWHSNGTPHFGVPI